MDRNDVYTVLKNELIQLGVAHAERIKEHDNLLEQGVDSLILSGLIGKVEAIIGKELPIEQYGLADFATLQSIYENIVLTSK